MITKKQTNYSQQQLTHWHMISTNHVHNLVVNVAALLLKYAKDNITILDIGSNSGRFTELLSSQINIVGGLLVEPHPDLISYSEVLLGDKFQYENIALSDYDGSGTLAVGYGDLETEHGINLGISRLTTHECETHGRAVEIKKFDTVWKNKYKTFKPGLIKIDAEDSDIKILHGMKDFLNSLEEKPIIIYEFSGYCLSKNESDEIHKDLSFLRDMGYESVWHDTFAPTDSSDVAILVK